MKSNSCPHCGHTPSVPFWRKSCLGPAVTTDCRACHKKVSVAWSSLLVLIPMFAAMSLAPFASSVALKAGIWAAALVIGCYVQWKSVPLVQKRGGIESADVDAKCGPMKCSICSRTLNNPNDPLSGDCGGDCCGCIGEIEAESGSEPSLTMVRREFASGLRPGWRDPASYPSGENPHHVPQPTSGPTRGAAG